MRPRIFLPLIFTAFFAASCATTRQSGTQGVRPVYITNSKKIALLPPSDCAFAVDGAQRLTGTFGGTTFALLSYTQIDKDGISLILMNDFGTDMGTLSYDAAGVTFSSAFFPKNLPGEYIIADIQNAFYDAAALQSAYSASKLIFEAQTADNGEHRTIRDGTKLIEEIFITADGVTIKNYLRGYEYSLEF